MKKNICLPFLLFFLISCNFSKQPPPIIETPQSVEYPVGFIAQQISANLFDLHELYPLSEEFLEKFMKMHAQYEGVHPTVATEFPEEWGVVVVERLPEGRELYQIQSQNREWVYLVITSGYGMLRILDVLPVAVNLVYQTENLLETEIWTTEKMSDGTFVVSKKYEWIRSVENATQKEYEANPQNFLRTKAVMNKYFINDLYRFETIITEDAPDYSAVIFYYKDEKPEDWDEILPMLQAFCEDYTILFEVAYDNFSRLPLYDYKLNFVTELNITPYTDLAQGVIFMKNGENPKTVPFGSYERMKIEMKRYFKIVVQTD